MNIYTISEKAGVSTTTVSRVLNNSSKVSAETKKKVHDVIKECGYTPNNFARSLGLNSSKTIGILCADCSDQSFARSIFFVEQGLRERGYDCLLCCTGYSYDNKKKYLSLLMQKRVDSIVMIGSVYVEDDDKKNDYIREIAEKIPIMMLNAFIDGKNIFCTMCDDYQAIYETTSTLISNKIQNILYCYNSSTYVGLRKLKGYCDALEKFKLPIRKEYIHLYKGPHYNIPMIRNYLVGLNRNGLKFDAIIASDDTLAIGAVKYAKQLNIRIPDYLAVIGYDNSSAVDYCDPELSSIDNKLKPMCQQCVYTLLNVLAGENVSQKIVFTAEFIQRGTTRI